MNQEKAESKRDAVHCDLCHEAIAIKEMRCSVRFVGDINKKREGICATEQRAKGAETRRMPAIDERPQQENGGCVRVRWMLEQRRKQKETDAETRR